MRKTIVALALLVFAVAVADATVIAEPDAGIPAPPAEIDAGPALPVITPMVLPNPTQDPVESVSYVVKLWKTGTMPAAIIVGLFLLLTALSRKLPWLQKGYAAIVTAATLGGCAVLLEPASRGTTPTMPMVLSALVTALALALKPKADK